MRFSSAFNPVVLKDLRWLISPEMFSSNLLQSFKTLKVSRICKSRKRWYHLSGTRVNQTSSIVKSWIEKFEEKSIPDAETSAEFIIAHVKGLKTLHCVDIHNLELTSDEVRTINRLCQLRLKRMPLQYVIGEWDFCDLTLKMRPPVFIPRVETEELIGHCRQSLNRLESHESLSLSKPAFLEIGCGSGAISIALLHEFKQLHAVAVDINSDACQLTQENAVTIGVDKRLKVIHGDITQKSVLSEIQDIGPFSLLVSNPPYIRTNKIPHLQTEIVQYEDHVALDGGHKGIDLIVHILNISSFLVKPLCEIWLEVGLNHPRLIQQFVESGKFTNLRWLQSIKDIYDRDRFCQLQVST